MKHLIRPEQTLFTARQAGLGEDELKMTGIAILTFLKSVVDRVHELCLLEDAEWLSPLHHPYAAPQIAKRGTFQGLGISLLVPPMGASPLSCIIEDLAACGVEVVFLACAAWSLGPPIQLGDLIVPTFSIGLDGTSTHYGNVKGEASVEPGVVDALVEACRAIGAQYHKGGNGTCEALYRISPQMAKGFRTRGCLCMDNGEANTLITVARSIGIFGGVLFQPYIDLGSGWDPNVFSTEKYRNACRLQAEVVLRAGCQLLRHGVQER